MNIHIITDDCDAGSYLTAYGCQQCPADTFSAVGAFSCTSCPTGYTSSAGSTSIADCIGGKLVVQTFILCQKGLSINKTFLCD